jgi:hypothetical protein
MSVAATTTGSPELRGLELGTSSDRDTAPGGPRLGGPRQLGRGPGPARSIAEARVASGRIGDARVNGNEEIGVRRSGE